MSSFTFFLLSLTLIVGACSKTKITPIPEKEKEEAQLSRLIIGSENYRPEIDVMVAFLWPERIENEKQRKAIAQIISDSRKLQKYKGSYFEAKLKLDRKFQSHWCDCALNEVCDGSEGELDLPLCEGIENEISQNNQQLVLFYELVEKVKSGVKESGGQWLETNLDFNLQPASVLDLEKEQLILNAFDSYTSREEKSPYIYQVSGFKLTQERSYQRLEFHFPRLFFKEEQFILKGHWHIDVSIQASASSLTFQGELSWEYQGIKRLGIIYWENPHL